MAAAHAGHTEVLRLLLEAGAPWNAIDKRGKCAGEYAMESGQQEAADLLLGAGTQSGWLTRRAQQRFDSPSDLSCDRARSPGNLW